MDPCVQSFLDKFSEDTEQLVRNLAKFNQLAEERNQPGFAPLDPPPCGSGCETKASGHASAYKHNSGGCANSDSKESVCYQPLRKMQAGHNHSHPSGGRLQSAPPTMSFQSRPNPCSPNPHDLQGVSKEHFLKYHNRGGTDACKFCSESKEGSGCPGELSAAGGYRETEQHIRSFAQRFDDTERTLRCLRTKIEDLNYVMKYANKNKNRHNDRGGNRFGNRSNCQMPDCEYNDPNVNQCNPPLIGLPRINLPTSLSLKSRNPEKPTHYDMQYTEFPSTSTIPSPKIPVIPGNWASELGPCGRGSRNKVSFSNNC